MIYHVTCNTDNNYAQHCGAMLCSLFHNNKNLEFCVHILTSNLSSEIQSYFIMLGERYGHEVKFYFVEESKLEGLQYRQNRPLTKAAYYRILLPSIIPTEIDKILYLDCDMIVLRSVEEIFQINIEQYALAATDDTSPYTEIHRQQLEFDTRGNGFCSGIMLINLKYWRERNAQERLLKFSKKPRFPVYLHDQDALNYVFRNQWFHIPPKWNHTTLSISPLTRCIGDNFECTFRPIIWHYSSALKPWFNVSFPGKKHYDKYLEISEFPNSKYEKKHLSFRFSTYCKVGRYYISRYVYPLVPDSIEIVLKDIFSLGKFLSLLLFRPSKINGFLVHKWENKKSNL